MKLEQLHIRTVSVQDPKLTVIDHSPFLSATRRMRVELTMNVSLHFIDYLGLGGISSTTVLSGRWLDLHANGPATVYASPTASDL